MTGPLSLLRGVSLRRGLTFVLVTQFVIAVLLVASDIDARWITRLTQDKDLPNGPVSPGDQLRRYEPLLIRPNFTRPASLPDEVRLPQDLPPRLEFKVSEGSGGNFLLINGPIEPGDAERFSAFLSNLGELTMSVVLNSPGGAVTEALAIGRLLRENKATTIVHSGTACLSACPYILAGGVLREVSSRGAVGMHQHYYDTPAYMPVFLAVEGIQHGQGRTMEYLLEMGISPSLMLYSLNTPPDSIYVLVKEELLETGLATSVFD